MKDIIKKRKFAILVSYRFNSKVVSSNPLIINFKCPYCGDSKKSDFKKRGYLIEKGDSISYYCHNDSSCSRSFNKFLQEQDPGLFHDYRFEGFQEKKEPLKFMVSQRTIDLQGPIKIGTSIVSLDEIHPAKKYLQGRKIPVDKWDRLYFVESINTITNQIEKYRYKEYPEEPVIVIPAHHENKISYLLCRSIRPESPIRYFLLHILEEAPKIWFLNTVDTAKKIYVTEGPLDALCIDNSIAISGARFLSSLEFLKRKGIKDNLVIILDNEYTSNKEIKGELEKIIDNNYSVVVFNNSFPYKDINECVVKGNYSKSDVMQILQKRTFSGLRAKLELGKVIR